MTITTINNATALGTTTDLTTQQPTKTILQNGTTAVILNSQIVTSSAFVNKSNRVRLWYAISPFSLTADTTLPLFLTPTADYLDLIVGAGASTTIDTSGVIANNGGFLYTWYDSPALGSGSPTITVTSVELP